MADSWIDRFLPRFDFSETHETRIAATPAVVDAAVRALDAGSRRRFRIYSTVVRPFRGLIRRVALAEIRRSAEAAHR